MIFFEALLTTLVATALGASILHKEIDIGHRTDLGKHQHGSSVNWPELGDGDTEHHTFIGNVATSRYIPHTEHLHHHDEEGEDKHHAVVIHIEVDTPHHSWEGHYDQQHHDSGLHDLKHNWQHENSEEDHHNWEHELNSEEEHDFKHHQYPGYQHVNEYHYPDDQVLRRNNFGGQWQHNLFDPYHYYYGIEGHPSSGVHQFTGHYGDFPQYWTNHQAGYDSVPVYITKHHGLVHYPHTGNVYGTNQQLQAQQREKFLHLLALGTVSPTHASLKHVEVGNKHDQDYTGGQPFVGADVLHPDDTHHDDTHH